MPTSVPNAEDLQAELDVLLRRSATLTKERDRLIREAATLEERRDSAITELERLGYATKGKSAKQLQAMLDDINTELNGKMTELEEALEKGEALLGSSRG